MDSRKNILILSYFFKPFPGVGAKRTTYWFERLSEVYNTTVFTATKQRKKDEQIIYVAPEKKNSILSKIIKDEGVKWINPIKKELLKNNKEYDYIIISGGPFMHMLISKFLKKKFHSRIILDFRDPFYANPRFNTNFIKDRIKLFFQNRFLKYSDEVITVNDYCAKLISFDSINIIDNGYDDSIKTTNNKIIKKKLISIGRLDTEFNINYFNQLMSENSDYKFYYYGIDSDLFRNSNSNNLYSPIDYKSVLDEISSSEICVLFTTGLPFESTTKIFDFLAFNKKILIITQAEPQTGSLHQITKDYPNVKWAKNNLMNISQALTELHKTDTVPFDTSVYSRNNGFQKLFKLIEE